jgi:phosphate transport system permease protein
MTVRLPVSGVADLAGDARRRRKERVIKSLFLTAAVLSILVSVGIILSVVGNAIHFLTLVHLSNLTVLDWNPRGGEFGFATLFAGTMLVTIIAMSSVSSRST